jgi:hypothetical protein
MRGQDSHGEFMPIDACMLAEFRIVVAAAIPRHNDPGLVVAL